MTTEMITQLIQIILAPVVMISACSILQNGLLGHYATINDRIRALSRERLDLLRSAGMRITAVDLVDLERIREIDAQVPELLRRHQWMRDAVLSIFAAILLFVTDMLTIAASVTTHSAWITVSVLVMFLSGTAAMFVGTLLTIVEVRASHHAVEAEARRVAALGGPESRIGEILSPEGAP